MQARLPFCVSCEHSCDSRAVFCVCICVRKRSPLKRVAPPCLLGLHGVSSVAHPKHGQSCDSRAVFCVCMRCVRRVCVCACHAGRQFGRRFRSFSTGCPSAAVLHVLGPGGSTASVAIPMTCCGPTRSGAHPLPPTPRRSPSTSRRTCCSRATPRCCTSGVAASHGRSCQPRPRCLSCCCCCACC